jgi:dTMP kinase
MNDSKLRFFGEGLPYLEGIDAPGVLVTVEGTDGVGRTTQIARLREWLELRGHGVLETGWTRSELVGATISHAKRIRALNRYTYALLYAADFADRFEKEILPALRNGFLVLADRYVYTAFARALVRGADKQWVRDLYAFAPVPHLVIYLRADAETVIRRSIPRGAIDPFEAGLDMGFGDDLYDSFKRYQTLLIAEYDRMAEEFGFHTVDACLDVDAIQKHLQQTVADFFVTRAAQAGS